MERSRKVRIVMMSSDVMKLYDVMGTRDDFEFQPITFYDPQECLDMLIDVDPEEEDYGGSIERTNAEKLEKQWGELELRLSFFTDAQRWQ